MRRALLFVLVVGCQADQVDFPRHPAGGGGGGGIGGGGGGNDDANNFEGTAVTGKVCRLSDLRKLDECDPTGLQDLVVTLGANTATTNDVGNFVIEDPGTTGLFLKVSGGSAASIVVSALEPYDPQNVVIHTMRAIDYDDLRTTNGMTPPLANTGAIVERVIDANQPAVDATATATNLIVNQILFDSTSKTTWGSNTKTGALGIVWIPQAIPGAVDLTIKASGAATGTTNTRNVVDQSITFGTFGL